jgi:hypothetical protein
MTRSILLILSALLLGWNAGGETEPMRADGDLQDRRPGRQTETIASPNPSVKESDEPQDAPAPPVTAKKVEAKAIKNQAPMKKPRKHTDQPPKQD